MELTGGCMCGAVRYRAAGQPERVGICHCATCRKNTGAPFSAFAVYPRARVTFVSGDTGFFCSSAEVKRHFCRECGSPVFGEASDSDEMELYLGSFDEPERLRPEYELWTIRRQPWLPDMPELVGHERNPVE